MSAKRIVIKSGTVTGFADEVSFEGLDLVDFSKRRVSYVIPKHVVLKEVFSILRTVFSEQSKVAAWTRKWRCLWMVHIDGECYGPFSDRKHAILFEKEKIYMQGKLGVVSHA